jgi:hypothetical protein
MCKNNPCVPKMSKNIQGDANDAHARYKRDIIQIKHEAAKGGQTRLLNIETIAQQLHLPLKVLLSAMQKLLHLPPIRNCIIPSRVEVDKVEAVIDKIIQDIVLCQKCHLPELNLRDVCRSCGQKQKRGSDKKVKPTKKEPVEIKAVAEEETLPAEISLRMNQLYGEVLALRCPANMQSVDIIMEALWEAQTKDQLEALAVEIKALIQLKMN